MMYQVQPNPAATVSGVAILPQAATRCSDLCQESLPVFGCPAVGKPTKGDNRRSRRAAKKASKPNAKSTMFEFVCSDNSQMGFTHDEYSINHVRLCKDRIDLGDESQCEQLENQIDEAAEVAPPHMWASIPCTSGSPWQYINRKKGGAAFIRKLAHQVKESKRLFSSFTKRAERVLNHNGTVTFEWPRPCSGWKRPDVVAFFEKHPQFMCGDFEGCAVGLTTRDGLPLKKPWRLMTTSQRIKDVFQDKRCKCQQTHARCEGAKALWLGRLARPDIIKPINDLATKVQSWSRGNDKKVLRLIQYIASTPHYRLVGTIQDKHEDLELRLFVDADFAGDKSTARSTSGGFLALSGPSSFFPLAWISKRQTSTSRSTTESEVVSLAHSLYQEGLPVLQYGSFCLHAP